MPRGQLAAGCLCPICQARKSTSKSGGSSGSLNNVEIVKKVQILTEEEEPVQKPESNTMCKECFQSRTVAGIQHSCTPTASKRNLAELVSREESSEEIVAKVLKDTVEEGSSSAVWQFGSLAEADERWQQPQPHGFLWAEEDR